MKGKEETKRIAGDTQSSSQQTTHAACQRKRSSERDEPGREGPMAPLLTLPPIASVVPLLSIMCCRRRLRVCVLCCAVCVMVLPTWLPARHRPTLPLSGIGGAAVPASAWPWRIAHRDVAASFSACVCAAERRRIGGALRLCCVCCRRTFSCVFLFLVDSTIDSQQACDSVIRQTRGGWTTRGGEDGGGLTQQLRKKNLRRPIRALRRTETKPQLQSEEVRKGSARKTK